MTNTQIPVVEVRQIVPSHLELHLMFALFPSLALRNYLNLFTMAPSEFHSLPSQHLLPFIIVQSSMMLVNYLMFTFSFDV